MNAKKIKVAMVTNHLGIMGISAIIMNYCKALDYNKFDLTIIAGSPVAEQYKSDCGICGVNIVELPSRHQKTAAHYFQLWRDMKKNKYDIVHIHGNSSMMAFELMLAKMAGVKVSIAHSHNSTCSNMGVHRMLNPYFKKMYTQALACGMLAGDWLFGKGSFKVLPNGLNTEQFLFNEVDRKRIRRELCLEGKFVVGHIGRFNSQKNQPYVLKVFEKIVEKRKDAVLLLVGTGPDFDKTKTLVEAHPYKNYIILYGETGNAPAMYSTMDVFVLPSLYEGLPVALLEAQISGLPCVVSDKVTKEVVLSSEIKFVSLEAETDKWAEEILKEQSSLRENFYETHMHEIMRYEIRKNVKMLEQIYEKAIETARGA